jgi:hypothetical protein
VACGVLGKIIKKINEQNTSPFQDGKKLLPISA